MTFSRTNLFAATALTLALMTPAAARMSMPMSMPMSHGAGGACHDAALACASTVSPVLAAGGNLWLAFDSNDQVYVTHSSDMGHTFSKPVAVTHGKVHLDTGPDARTALAVDKQGRVFLAYEIFKDNDFNGEVFFSRSLDQGKSFSMPRPLVDNTASQRFASLTVGPNGNLFAAWLDKRGVVAAEKLGKTYPGAALGYQWSKDGGASFTPSKIAKDNTCECCRLGVAFTAPERPAVVFRNVFGGTIRDHGIITFDGETTPGPFHRVSVDNWKLNGCPHQGPSLALSNAGTYHVVWSTQGDARKGLFYARSKDGGKSFSTPMPLDANAHDTSRPYVTTVPGQVWLAWKDFDGVTATVNVRVSHDDGVTWSTPRVAAKTKDASDHPMLVNDGHHAYLSWMTKVDGYKFLPLEDAQ
jgi:hypothetical protein